jgi:hypothetical protein
MCYYIQWKKVLRGKMNSLWKLLALIAGLIVVAVILTLVGITLY